MTKNQKYVTTSADIKCDFAFQVKGDGMVSAGILDGDFVFITQQDDVESGQLAVVAVYGEMSLERVYKYKNVIMLCQDSPKYKAKSFIGADMENVWILGKVVLTQRKY